MRWRVLSAFERRLDRPLAVLGLVWLALFILDVTRGLGPALTGLNIAIWLVFVADFVLRLLLAPDRLLYLRRSWLTALSLLVPALRVFRFAAAARAVRVLPAARGVRLVRAVGSLNRGMTALAATMRRRGVSYVVALTVAVVFAGAAGMYALEPATDGGGGFTGYADALWWTAMIITTIGSAYWPRTPEGRILAVLISVYAIGVFGYLTAALASFFVGREAAAGAGDLARSSELRALRTEIAGLRREMAGGRTGAAAGGTSSSPPTTAPAAPPG